MHVKECIGCHFFVPCLIKLKEYDWEWGVEYD